MSMQYKTQRIAINRLITPQGVISPALIELDGDRVVAYQKLDRELPFTEWRGGEMVLAGET